MSEIKCTRNPTRPIKRKRRRLRTWGPHPPRSSSSSDPELYWRMSAVAIAAAAVYQHTIPPAHCHVHKPCAHDARACCAMKYHMHGSASPAMPWRQCKGAKCKQQTANIHCAARAIQLRISQLHIWFVLNMPSRPAYPAPWHAPDCRTTAAPEGRMLGWRAIQCLVVTQQPPEASSRLTLDAL